MNSHIIKVNANLLGGIAVIEVPLSNGLNFIAGENGTAKSKLLEFIKTQTADNQTILTDTSAQIATERIAFYNPKRNAQKKETIGLLQQVQREGKTRQAEIAKLNQSYADQGYTEYPNFADMFITAVNETIGSQNVTPESAVNSVRAEFETVIKKVLPYFDFEASWDTSSQQPSLMLKKYGHGISAGQLSVGENEIFALTASVYLSRESFDVYLIDEPEVHLNWSLEKNLFEFLNWFASSEHKQLIVVTHSPVVFEEKFINETTFLVWDNNTIKVSLSPSDDIINSLASRVANTIVKLDDAYEKTFFVEDSAQKEVIDELAKIKKKNVQVVIVGGRAQVIHWHRTISGTLTNAIFMVDGDNDEHQNASLSGSIFALKKYCIENYLLNPEILAAISKVVRFKTKRKVEGLIIRKAVQTTSREFKKRYLANIKLAKRSSADFLKIIDHMDGSYFISEAKLYSDLGFASRIDFIEAYILKSAELKKLNYLFKEITQKFQ